MNTEKDRCDVLLNTSRREVIDALTACLQPSGLGLSTTDTVASTWSHILHRAPLALVIDVTAPTDPECWNLCRACAELNQSRVIALIDDNDEVMQVQALAYGADQCVTLSSGLQQLAVYLTAQQVLHSSSRLPTVPTARETPTLRIDIERRRVFRDRERVSLSRQEFALLVLLARSEGNIVPHCDIQRALWKSHRLSYRGLIKQYVLRLRRKIEPDPAHPIYLETVRGIGYCLLHSDFGRGDGIASPGDQVVRSLGQP